DPIEVALQAVHQTLAPAHDVPGLTERRTLGDPKLGARVFGFEPFAREKQRDTDGERAHVEGRALANVRAATALRVLIRRLEQERAEAERHGRELDLVRTTREPIALRM